MTKIEPFIHRKVVVLHQDAPVNQAARVMRERGIGCVLVSDHQGHIVGIVTDRDLATRVLAESQDPKTPLLNAMTAHLAFVDEGADLEQVISLMEKRGVRRIPVIRRTPGGVQKCEGLISLDDLLASKLIHEQQLMRIVRSQVLRRMGLSVPSRKEGLKVVGGHRTEVESFFDEILKRMNAKTSLSPTQVQEITQLILTLFVRRLHHTGAMHLILQLPEALRQELLDIPSGPDPSISPARMVSQIAQQFDLDHAQAEFILTRICGALSSLIDSKQLDQVKAQLPLDLRALLSTQEIKAAQKLG